MIGAMALHERRLAERKAVFDEFQEEGGADPGSDMADEIVALRKRLGVTDAMVERAVDAYCDALYASESGKELYNAIIDSPKAQSGIVVCDDVWMRAALTAALTETL